MDKLSFSIYEYIMKKTVVVLVKVIGALVAVHLLFFVGLFGYYFFKNPDQKIEAINDDKQAKATTSQKPTGDLVIIKGDLLKAVKDPSILREGRMVPRMKDGTIKCFEIAIDKGSKLNELKLMNNDCVISFTSFKRQGKGLISEEVILNSVDAMKNVLPALNGTVRINLRYYRNENEATSFYFLED